MSVQPVVGLDVSKYLSRVLKNSEYQPIRPVSPRNSPAEADSDGWANRRVLKSSLTNSEEDDDCSVLHKKSNAQVEPQLSELKSPKRIVPRGSPDKPIPANFGGDTAADVRGKPQTSYLNRLAQLKRGHGLTYAALFLFTVVLYARPAEFYPSPLTSSIAFIVGVITLVVFVPSQLALENTLTARPREVNLVLLLCLMGLLSLPLAISPGEAWAAFSNIFIRCVIIFIVMVNVVRTEARLKGLLFLAVAVGLWLSVGAINDYRLGLATVEGYRVGGRGSSIFGNSNDMALHLVTIVPIVASMSFATRSILRKCVYGLCVAIMVAGIVFSYSRGAFIGLVVASGILVWKLGQQRRFSVAVLAVVVVGLFLVLVPGNYGIRILSIFVPSLDPFGSSDARREELLRSLNVALHHPLLGIGMGNYASQMSYRGLVTHNSYTQVAAEMGWAAFVCYTMFVVMPFRRLGQIARESFATRSLSRYFYLAVGLQASLGAYLVASFFASVAYYWYVYYLVGYAVCFRRIYESETRQVVVLDNGKKKEERRSQRQVSFVADMES